MTPQEIKDEIVNDPTGRGYKNPDTSWKGASVVLGLINDKNISYPKGRPIQMAELVKWSAKSGVLSRIEDKKDRPGNGVTDPGARALLFAASALMTSPHFLEFDPADADVDLMISSLVSVDILSSTEESELRGLAGTTQSRAEQLWGLGRGISVADYRRARELI